MQLNLKADFILFYAILISFAVNSLAGKFLLIGLKCIIFLINP